MMIVLLVVVALLLLHLLVYVGMALYERSVTTPPIPGEWRLRERVHCAHRLHHALLLVLVFQPRVAWSELVNLQAWMAGYDR